MRQVSRIVVKYFFNRVNCLLTKWILRYQGFGEGRDLKIRPSRDNRCEIANSRPVVHGPCVFAIWTPEIKKCGQGTTQRAVLQTLRVELKLDRNQSRIQVRNCLFALGSTPR